MCTKNDQLVSQQCTACRADAPHATTAQIDRWLPEIPEWTLIRDAKSPILSRQYTSKNFLTALAFANRVGELAESEGHHPLITVQWGSTLVQWWTHAISGLHENDFIMAAKTDALFME